MADETARALRRAWFRFPDTMEPHRPDLDAYAMRLTGDVFSAEDLVQDTLLRGYAAVGRRDLHGDTNRARNVRAYLFSTASNLWIDHVRRTRHDPAAAAAPALVLRAVFAYTNREIAEMLDTAEGAVKAALHRGRGKLAGVPARHRVDRNSGGGRRTRPGRRVGGELAALRAGRSTRVYSIFRRDAVRIISHRRFSRV